MIRNSVVYLLMSLVYLPLVACGTFVLDRQQEPAPGQAEVVEIAKPVSDEADALTTAAAGAETPLLETEDTPSTVTTEMEYAEMAVLEAESSSGDDAVYAQKVGETVVLPACYDFDNGTSVVPPDPACDFSMLPGPDSGAIEIYPQARAQLAYGGVFPEAPTLAQCTASSAFSDDMEVVAPLAAMYVCYRTGEGRTGYLHFTSADVEQAGILTLDWVTFAGESGTGGDGGSEDLIYRNETFGFHLTLPGTWAGYQATQNGGGDHSAVCFSFPDHGPICVLQVDVYSIAAWDELTIKPSNYYLGENEQVVFAAGTHQAECVQLDDFQCARYREIPGILAGFVVE